MAAAEMRICAGAIVTPMCGGTPDPVPVFSNTCYNYVSDRMAMHIVDGYRYDAQKQILKIAEGAGLSAGPSEIEDDYAR